MSDLDVLRELTNNLPPVIPLQNGKRVVFDIEKGISIMWNVWQDCDDKANIVGAQNIEGTEFPWHTHDTHEFLIFYTGQVEIEFEDGAILLTAPAHYHVKPDVPHRLYFREDSRAFAIFVPANQEVWSE